MSVPGVILTFKYGYVYSKFRLVNGRCHAQLVTSDKALTEAGTTYIHVLGVVD